MTDNAADTFPGWYPDPRGEADQRFWNGREWTPNTRVDVPAAQFIPASSTGSDEATAPVAPKRVAADAANGSGGNGSKTNGASVEKSSPETASAEPGRARIFGGPLSGDTATKVATKTDLAKTELAKTELAKTGPAKTDRANEQVAKEPAEKEPAKQEPVAEPVSEVRDAKSPTTANSLFGKTEESRAGTAKPTTARAALDPSGLDPESRELTERIDNDPLLHKTANRPTVAPVTPQATPPASGFMGKLVGSGLALLLLGGLIGWAIGRSGNDDPVVSDDQASVATTAGDTATPSADETTDDTEAGASDVEADDATAELQTTVDDLTSELEATGAEVDALTVERDNALEHNEILQTWFTADVRANSERAWDLGVQRACDADADPTIENTSYTRAMELIGTHADLVTAALVCRSEG